MSRKQKRESGDTMPDAEKFVRLIDEGLAEPRDVALAYVQAIHKSNAGKTDAEVLREIKVVQERPRIDPAAEPSAGDRLIRLHRELVVFGDDA